MELAKEGRDKRTEPANRARAPRRTGVFLGRLRSNVMLHSVPSLPSE